MIQIGSKYSVNPVYENNYEKRNLVFLHFQLFSILKGNWQSLIVSIYQLFSACIPWLFQFKQIYENRKICWNIYGFLYQATVGFQTLVKTHSCMMPKLDSET